MMFVRIADRIRGIRRIELSSDNFRQQHKAGKNAPRVSFSSRSNAPSLPEIEIVGIRVESRQGRKKMALFRGILPLEEGGKKKKKMRVGRGERIRSSARCDEAWQVATGNRYVGETKPSTYLLTYCEGNHEKVTRARSQPCYARKVKFTVDWQRDKEFAQ